MGLASALNTPTMAIQCATATLPGNERLLLRHPNSRPTRLYLPLRPLPHFSSTLALARRRNHDPASSSSLKKNKKSLAKNRVLEDEDDIDEDAFEALFNQLGEDLKNDDLSLDNGDDEDISEEDLAMLEQELAEAFGGVDSENEDEEVDEEGEEEEKEEEPPVKLKNWQVRRLASALKAGRRKTSTERGKSQCSLHLCKLLPSLSPSPSKPVSSQIVAVLCPTQQGQETPGFVSSCLKSNLSDVQQNARAKVPMISSPSTVSAEQAKDDRGIGNSLSRDIMHVDAHGRYPSVSYEFQNGSSSHLSSDCNKADVDLSLELSMESSSLPCKRVCVYLRRQNT